MSHHHHHHCGDEAHDHDHHDHEHDHDTGEGPLQSLYSYIDIDKVRGMNIDGDEHKAMLHIIRPYHERLQKEEFVDSDADAQMILHVPFKSAVKIRAINIVGGGGDTSPSNIEVFVNRDDIDFTNVNDLTALQEIECIPTGDPQCQCDYPTKYTKLQSVFHLTLFIKSNFSGDEDEPTRLHYVGMKGEGTVTRRGIVDAVYESQAQKSDHKVKDDSTNSHMVL